MTNDRALTWAAFFDRVEEESWLALRDGRDLQASWHSPYPEMAIAVYGASVAFVCDEDWYEVDLEGGSK